MAPHDQGGVFGYVGIAQSSRDPLAERNLNPSPHPYLVASEVAAAGVAPRAAGPMDARPPPRHYPAGSVTTERAQPPALVYVFIVLLVLQILSGTHCLAPSHRQCDPLGSALLSTIYHWSI